MMRVLLIWKTANELKTFENDIKNHTGAYRPRLQDVQVANVSGMPIYMPIHKKEWVNPISCWPFEDDNKSEFIQEQIVKEGCESEVDDVCFAKIDGNTITYKVSDMKFAEPFEMKEWTMFILNPDGNYKDPVLVKNEDSLKSLMENLKEYRIGLNNVYKDDIGLDECKMVLDKEFNKLRGCATFILLHNGHMVHTCHWDNKKYDYLRNNM